MGLTNTHLLLSVNFLHFLSAGLVAPVLTQHITSNGGNHIILGALVAALYVCSRISKSFVNLSDRGKKFSVTLCLFSSFFTYLVLVYFSTCWIICVSRCIYELTNHITLLSKEYIARGHLKNQQIKTFNLIDVLKVAGIVLGSIMGGYIFDYTEDFGAIAMITSILTFLGILVLQYMDEENLNTPKQEAKTSLSTKYYQLCQKVQNISKVEFRKKWDRILLKSTYTFAFAIYFSRFAFLISLNYEIGIIIIGYSVAYQHMLKFACDSFVPLIQERVKNEKCLFEHCLVICGFTLSGLYYAPTYEFYLILFVPMIFTYTLINYLLENDILDLKSHKEASEVIEIVDDFINIFAPICFGILCQVFGGQAFKMLAVLPFAACAYLVNQRFTPIRREESEDKVKEE